jgi:hypothetical protein
VKEEALIHWGLSRQKEVRGGEGQEKEGKGMIIRRRSDRHYIYCYRKQIFCFEAFQAVSASSSDNSTLQAAKNVFSTNST